MTDPTIALTQQLLEWISDKPRTYAEVLNAWRTTCPRLAIWEDACADGLIKFDPNADRIVSLSPKGQALLQSGLPNPQPVNGGTEACSGTPRRQSH
jgi:hypothetical protein